LEPIAGKTVVLGQITGPDKMPSRLQAAFFEHIPTESSESIRLLTQADLQRYSTIQLASASGRSSSDVAIVHAARLQDIDLILTAELLQQRGHLAAGSDSLTVSWRLLDAEQNKLLGGMPIRISNELLESEYPQLANLPDREQAMIEAAARESWRLLAPHVRTNTVRLAKPYLAPGAKMVRDGNQFAATGNWFAAEQIWRQASVAHPNQDAAFHNLALAAAARQDFAESKRLAQQALKIHSSEMYEQTIVWIEARQMDLTKAFDLAPPPGGWLFSSEGRSAGNSVISTSE
jgi:hypothetical protein